MMRFKPTEGRGPFAFSSLSSSSSAFQRTRLPQRFVALETKKSIMFQHSCRNTVKRPSLHIQPHRIAALSSLASSFAKTAQQPERWASLDNAPNKNAWWGRIAALGVVVAGTVVTTAITQDSYTTDCSGILAVIGSHGNSRDFLSQGLNVFKNRGFDGVGLATMNHEAGTLTISKCSVDPVATPTIAATTTAGDTTPPLTPVDTVTRLVRSHYAALERSKAPNPSIGMAHTRWATQGESRNQANAHPHVDSSGKIALIHNGTLINGSQLRRELQGMGHVFSSQTDSEVIAKLIGHYYYTIGKTTEGRSHRLTLRDATERALRRCDGTWGLCILCEDEPDELVVACNGSKMYIGTGDDEDDRIYVSSELGVFDRYTKNYIEMKDGEIGVLQAYGHRSLDLSRMMATPHNDNNNLQSGDEEEQLNLLPSPHPHWTLKEILEQPESLARAMGFGGRLGWEGVHLGGLDSKVDTLKQMQHLVLAGCGSSLNAARYGERIMKQLGSVSGSITSLDVVDAEEHDLPFHYQQEDEAGTSSSTTIKSYGATGMIAMSQSGETKTVNEVVTSAMERGVTVMSVVNTVGSLLPRTTKLGVYCNAGQENGVVSTKTFTSEVAVLALIALWFRQVRDQTEGSTSPTRDAEELKEALLRLPISFGMALKTRDQCKEVAARLKDKRHCFVLGKGFAEPVAYEGALKIKEMSYMHAEGYSGGALKHGPFALIEDQNGKFGATPIIMFILDDQHAHHMRTAAEEVKARGAELIIITDKKELARDLVDDPIIIPQNGPLTALGAIVPMHLIAYELAILRGINPDAPRNLSKFF